MVFLRRSAIEICWSCEVWLFYITVLIIYFWWHLFIITPLLYLVCLLSCMYILLVFTQKFSEWETSPQIKFGDASLGVQYLCGSILLTWRVQVFLLFIALFQLNALNSFPFRLFPLAWSCLIYENCHLCTCPFFVFSSLSTRISSYFFCDPEAQIGSRPSQCWDF